MSQYTSHNDDALGELTRRGFLKSTFVGMATLTVSATTASLSGCAAGPADSAYQILRAHDRAFLAACIPTIAGTAYPGALGEQAIERTLKKLDELIYTLHEFNRDQLLHLFDLLSFAPLRLLMGAQWASWSEASSEQVDDFLNGWRDSALQIKRMGYISLVKLISISWYAQPENFASVGYPGPPKHIPPAAA